mmetsp:Transcript_33213/g.71772  ORF Transcript_33213/g.71772 Transcript_33213/m.71772 type:complete len:85 (+) Transcript_33213:172-426(+)
MNPYAQRQQASSFPPQACQQTQRQAMHVHTSGRFSPVPHSAPKPFPTSAISISPTLTRDQVNRMEENRRRALAIRMKKQNNSSH